MSGQRSLGQRGSTSHPETRSKDLLKSRVAQPASPDLDTPNTIAQLPTDKGALPLRAMHDPASLSRRDVAQLQRQIGNRAVVQLLQKQTQASSSAQRLPGPLEGAIGSIFDVDLAKVRIHTDSPANQLARTAPAEATTIGSDIYFQQGAYRPGTADGNALIAREVSQIQRAKMTGSPDRGSSVATSADKRDSEAVGGLVHNLGPNPSDILKPADGPDKKPSKAQSIVLQRVEEDYSHSGTAGIVTSKVVQGIFTTVLGPISLLWRLPLIQKNIGEISGYEQVGTFTPKADDRHRYGDKPLGTAMRWLAGISEVLKEFTIWLGFASFIAAIVAAATHGVAAPVFVGLAAATAIVAGVHFVLRSLLVALNGYRLSQETNETAKKFIRHQMVSDGVEAIGAALAAVFGGLGAGGVTSAGSALASAAGHGSADHASKLAGFGLSAATQGLATSVATNTGKEGGKEAVKPSLTPDKKPLGFKEGFLKDWGEITKAVSKDSWTKRGVRPQPAAAPDAGQDVVAMGAKIDSKAGENTRVQAGETAQAVKHQDLFEKIPDQMVEVTGDLEETRATTKKTAADVGGFNSDEPLEKALGSNKAEAKAMSQRVEKGLTIPEPDSSSSSGDADALTQIQQDQIQFEFESTATPIDNLKRSVQRNGGLRSRATGWLASKFGGLKAGVRRLNAKILAGVLKFAGKFDKSETDRKTAIAEMVAEKTFAASAVRDESENDRLFQDFQGKAAQLKTGVKALAEKDK